MTQDYKHPVTPPPELVQQWATSSPLNFDDENWGYELFIAHHAAQWGADQELEACCEWVSKYLPYLGAFPMPEDALHADRRPKSPSLKGQALLAIDTAVADDRLSADVANVVRRALEQLND